MLPMLYVQDLMNLEKEEDWKQPSASVTNREVSVYFFVAFFSF